MSAPRPGSRTVATVIPCRNEARRLPALLYALTGQSRPPDEIVVVDDRSIDRSAEIVRAWAEAHPQTPVRVVTGAGRGPGPAMNVGIASTSADIIMRMDGHAVPATDYLERSLATALRDGGTELRDTIGVVGGVWDVQAGAPTSVARAIAAVVSHPVGSGGAAYRSAGSGSSTPRDVDTVPFGTFPRAVWEALDGFDESLEANQDYDFNYRARAAGYRVVLDPSIRCAYFARPTLWTLARQYFRYGFWKWQMLRKHPRSMRSRQLLSAALLPWVLATAALAIVRPSVGVGVVALLYPLVVVSSAIHVALTRRVNPASAVAAIAVVHLAWSAGFWAGTRGGRR